MRHSLGRRMLTPLRFPKLKSKNKTHQMSQQGKVRGLNNKHKENEREREHVTQWQRESSPVSWLRFFFAPSSGSIDPSSVLYLVQQRIENGGAAARKHFASIVQTNWGERRDENERDRERNATKLKRNQLGGEEPRWRVLEWSMSK